MKKKFVLARGMAGTYAGYLVKENNEEVTLEDAFCLWRWSGANNLMDVAMEGVKRTDNCRFSVNVPLMRLKKVLQVIPCTEVAEKNLQAVQKWKFQ